MDNIELKLILESLRAYNKELQNLVTTGKETVELLETHINHLQEDERPPREELKRNLFGLL